MRKPLRALIALTLFLTGFQSTSNAQENLFTDRIDIWSAPDSSLTNGLTINSFYKTKQYRYVFREIIPTEVGGNTYFAILGANHGKEFPTFYGGIQQSKDGNRYAIFSAWDVGSDTQCGNCKEGTAPEDQKVSVWAKGTRTVTRPFGYEGTGMNSMINGFNWELGVKVGMLVSVEPAGSGSLISAAFKNGSEPWEFMTSFYVPSRFDMGMPGNYSFLEDWTGGDENVPRSYRVGPCYLEDEDGNGDFFINADVYASNISGTKIPNKHTVAVDGAWLDVHSGIGVQPQFLSGRSLQMKTPTVSPDISEGKILLEKVVAGKSTRYQEKLASLEAEAKTKAEVESKAAAELKAKQEAEAKAAAELKAKQEADAKAAAELKAKQEADAKAAADKAAEELKAKQDAEAKAAADKAAGEKIIADAKAEAARILAAAKAAAAKKKTTITCIKGKLIKKVTAVKPVCPKGYKKK
jgi:hypothetical protein